MPNQSTQSLFREPYRTQFREMILSGAGRVDVQDSPKREGYAHEGRVTDPFLDRETNRVDLHRSNICQYLKQHVSPNRILDVGCGTGGLSVALALTFPKASIQGMDPDPRSVAAASIRAAGYGVSIPFHHVEPNSGLPFGDEQFDLVTCTSVIEFITLMEDRVKLLEALKRVTRPGGWVFLTTPNPIRLREQHSGRWFGDWIQKPGYPWALRPWSFGKLFPGWKRVSTAGRFGDKLGVPLPGPLLSAVALAAPWQMVLVRKPV